MSKHNQVRSFRNTKAAKISPRGVRFKNHEARAKEYVPGPGTYRNIEGYSDNKNERLYHLSQFKNLMTRRFGTS
jgi:hypothetical protein